MPQGYRAPAGSIAYNLFLILTMSIASNFRQRGVMVLYGFHTKDLIALHGPFADWADPEIGMKIQN